MSWAGRVELGESGRVRRVESYGGRLGLYIPLPICEFPKSDFSKQLLFQTANMNFLYPTLVFLLMLAQGRLLTESPGVKPICCRARCMLSKASAV